MTGHESGRRHRSAADAWYYAQMATLTALALLVVGFMISAILLSRWPALGGPALTPLVGRPDSAQVQRQQDEIRDRWRRVGGDPVMNPQGPGVVTTE